MKVGMEREEVRKIKRSMILSGDREADVVLVYPRLNVGEGIQTSLGTTTTRGEEAPLLHPCNRTQETEHHHAMIDPLT